MSASLRVLAATAAGTVIATATTFISTPESGAAPTACPDIHVLAVQGTSQSAPNAPTKTDQGMLSAVIRPVLGAAAADKSFTVDRTYVPYRANFGDQGTASDYRDSAGEGLNRLSQLANRIITQCPSTKLVPIGYSQGGHVVDAFGLVVAQGAGSVTPDSIALGASYGSPTRGPGAPLFPTAAGQSSPRGLPDIGDITPTKFADQLPVSPGRGIGPEVDQITDFGALNGRIAQFCIPGDLACSAPRSASLLRLGANIAEQSNLDFANDATGTVGRIAAAVADTAVRGTSTVINSDLTGTSLADLQVNPNMSISQRLSDVSSPRSLSDTMEKNGATTSSPPTATGQANSGGPAPARPADGADNPLRAIARLGTIALNTATTFATAMLTPDNIASMVAAGTGAISAAAGLPTGGVAAGAAGAQLGSAAMNAGLEAVPPATAITAVKSVFTTMINEVKDNADLPQLVFDTRTWNQVAYHGGYERTPVSTSGATAPAVTADWIITAARAYAKARGEKEKPAPKPGTTAPTAPYRTVDTDSAKAAPAGAVEVNTRPATKNDHVVLAANTTPKATETGPQPAAGSGVRAVIPVSIVNDALTQAQRVEVASDPRFVAPNNAQRLARYGSIALPTQQVTSA